MSWSTPLERSQLLADFKKAFATWIETYNAHCLAEDTIVVWDHPSIQSAWNGWVSSFETYSTSYLVGHY